MYFQNGHCDDISPPIFCISIYKRPQGNCVMRLKKMKGRTGLIVAHTAEKRWEMPKRKIKHTPLLYELRFPPRSSDQKKAFRDKGKIIDELHRLNCTNFPRVICVTKNWKWYSRGGRVSHCALPHCSFVLPFLLCLSNSCILCVCVCLSLALLHLLFQKSHSKRWVNSFQSSGRVNFSCDEIVSKRRLSAQFLTGNF